MYIPSERVGIEIRENEKCSFGRKHFKSKSLIGKTQNKLARHVFNEIGNVSSVSSVYRILKFELKLSPYIYFIQRRGSMGRRFTIY